MPPWGPGTCISCTHMGSITQLLIPSYTLLTTTPQQQLDIRMVCDMIIQLNDLCTFLTVSEASACFFCDSWLGCVEACYWTCRELSEWVFSFINQFLPSQMQVNSWCVELMLIMCITFSSNLCGETFDCAILLQVHFPHKIFPAPTVEVQIEDLEVAKHVWRQGGQ